MERHEVFVITAGPRRVLAWLRLVALGWVIRRTGMGERVDIWIAPDLSAERHRALSSELQFKANLFALNAFGRGSKLVFTDITFPKSYQVFLQKAVKLFPHAYFTAI
jgi:hypothetical protein